MGLSGNSGRLCDGSAMEVVANVVVGLVLLVLVLPLEEARNARSLPAGAMETPGSSIFSARAGSDRSFPSFPCFSADFHFMGLLPSKYHLVGATFPSLNKKTD